MAGNVVESTDRCQACGKPLTGRQKTGCSPRCRAEASRRKRREEALIALGRAETALRDLRLLLTGESENLLDKV